MATVINCDRCKCYMDDKRGYSVKVINNEWYGNNSENEKHYINYDFCESCMARVYEALNDKKTLASGA